MNTTLQTWNASDLAALSRWRGVFSSSASRCVLATDAHLSLARIAPFISFGRRPSLTPFMPPAPRPSSSPLWPTRLAPSEGLR